MSAHCTAPLITMSSVTKKEINARVLKSLLNIYGIYPDIKPIITDLFYRVWFKCFLGRTWTQLVPSYSLVFSVIESHDFQSPSTPPPQPAPNKRCWSEESKMMPIFVAFINKTSDHIFWFFGLNTTV